MASEQVRDYLAADESLKMVGSAKFLDRAAGDSVSIALTDRRFICVSPEDEMVDVGYDHICAIRSRPRTRTTYSGNDHRLLVAAGGLLVAIAVVGVAVLARSVLVPAFVLVTAGSVVGAGYAWRDEVPLEAVVATARAKTVVRDAGWFDELRRTKRGVNEHLDDDQLQMGAYGLVAALGFVAVAGLTTGLLAPVFAVQTVVGVYLVDYAHRHRSDFDGIEIVRRRHQEVSIDTVGGRSIHLRTDPEAAIDRELGKLAHREGTDATGVTPAPS